MSVAGTYSDLGYRSDAFSYPGSSPVSVYDIKPLQLEQRNAFVVDASHAGNGTLDLSVGPLGVNLPHSVRDIGDQRFEVSFTPKECLNHSIGIRFDGIHVPGSPYLIPAPAVDLSGVTVTGQGHQLAKVGESAKFAVNCVSTRVSLPLELAIAGPSGQLAPTRVKEHDNRTFAVEWTPVTGGDHFAKIAYGGRSIPGSPFRVRVLNPQAVRVAPPAAAVCGGTVEYRIDTSNAGVGSLEGNVSASGIPVASAVQPDGPNGHTLGFIPTTTGNHQVSIRFDGQPVQGSPFTVNVAGGAQYVMITEPNGYHQVGDMVTLEIDARHAGEGQLMAEMRSLNNGVPNELKPLGNKSYELSFTPVEAGQHRAIITFNDEEVPQSPYSLLVQGDVLQPSRSGLVQPSPARAVQVLKHSQQARLAHSSSSPQLLPHRRQLAPPERQTSTSTHNYRNSTLEMRYEEPVDVAATMPLYDAPYGRQPSLLEQAPDYDMSPLTSTLTRQQVAPQYRSMPSIAFNDGLMFTRQMSSSALQRPEVTYPQRRLSSASVVQQTRTISYAPQLNNIMANEPSYFELNSHGLPINDLNVVITDPMNSTVPFDVTRLNDKYRVTFTPRHLGTYQVNVYIDGVPLPGSPYMHFVQHQGGVAVSDITRNGYVGQEMYFTVDSSHAVTNDIAVEVTHYGRPLNIRQERIGDGRQRYTFVPDEPGDHTIDVTLNYMAVPGSPFKVTVSDPYVRSNSTLHSDTMRRDSIPTVVSNAGNGLKSFAVTEETYFIIEMRGKQWSLPDMNVDVRAPNGELVPVSLIPQGSHEIRVEYQSPYVGRHSVDVYYKGQKLPDCPYYVEVFDPKKVSLQHMPYESVVQEQTEFEVVAEDAGRADMECRVISPSGLLIPCRIVNTARGMKVKYTPVEPGTYYVHTFIGGVEIPGSPMTQTVSERTAALLRNDSGSEASTAAETMTIQKRRTTRTTTTTLEDDDDVPAAATDLTTTFKTARWREHHESHGGGSSSSSKTTSTASRDSLGLITVHGDGLCYGEEDNASIFFIDTHDMHGTPVVQVEGPNSMAKVHIDPHDNSSFKVTYVPVEVGLYAIHVKWLNEEIQGSPFRARIIDPRKVLVEGGWHGMLDAKERLPLRVNEMKRILFNVTGAGPGSLRAEVKHIASGQVMPVSLDEKNQYEYYVSFVPTEAGDYIINIMWSDVPITHSPFRGFAVSGSLPVDYTKVILTGKGLREAYAGQRCEFIIDGSQAGQGMPRVTLRNSQLLEMQIQCEPLGFNRYRCIYTAPSTGEYLMYVSWSDRELRESPLRVVVSQSAAAEASKVAFNKSLTKSGFINQNFTTLIDTQFAGPGDLVASCMGPSRTAICELIEQASGQYLLSVKPREVGQHTLEVTYAGQHIAGSPHVFSVNSPPDPSKVRVNGPGVEHGILATFESCFFVHTQGAGAGNLSVRVRGPKGGFNVSMRRPSPGERTIECTFNPTEVGLYIVTVRWSDVDVPGSPFYVHIFDTLQELDRFCRYGSLPHNRREFTYQSTMSTSEPALLQQQQYRGSGGGSQRFRSATATTYRTNTRHSPSSLPGVKLYGTYRH